jgi:hypothetical protein
MRVRRKADGKEYMYYEWFVKPRDCVIKGCTSRGKNVTAHVDKTTYYNLAFCNFHYDLFYHSEEGLD